MLGALWHLSQQDRPGDLGFVLGSIRALKLTALWKNIPDKEQSIVTTPLNSLGELALGTPPAAERPSPMLHKAPAKRLLFTSDFWGS